jgi:hypothetical protein
MPWISAVSNVTVGPEPIENPEEAAGTPIAFIRRMILEVRHYSRELAAFSSVEEISSASDYRFMRELLPLSSENTIHARYANPSRIPKVIADYILHYQPFPDYLLCTLCIDAFPADPNQLKPKPFVGSQDSVRAQKRGQQKNEHETDNSFSWYG